VRLVVAQQSLKRILRWTQYVLFAVAASMLVYCGFVLIDAWSFQQAENRELDRQINDAQQAKGLTPQLAIPTSFERSPRMTGGLIGRMEIPRIGLSVMVVEGTTGATLRRAAGHISGTGLPGQPGNIGISGHRDTFFRPLRNIQPDDLITLTTLIGEYRYRVVSIKVVGPHDVAVLDPSSSEILTLVTCYPFYFVGPAPKRFVVRAKSVSSPPGENSAVN
jgi:sortase A